MFSKILVAIDDSASSQPLFEQAIELAKLNQSTLMVLHVLATADSIFPVDPYMGISQIAMESYWSRWNDRQKEGIQRLQNLEKEAITAGITMEFTQTVGDPGKVICDLARTWKSDLVLVGRRGLSGIGEFFAGSVSNYVFHHANCNVLVLQDIHS